ncbi:MAG: hypothetical protein KDD60_11255, partial [Bdellovibrionales bacterium]|nr:hypothetical protein [Bdellovibrionales bacterium]
MRLSIFLIITFISLLLGCGPKVQVAPDAANVHLDQFALLPGEFPDSLRPERQELLTKSFNSYLKGRGFQLLDTGLVEAVCAKDPKCPGREQLATRYGVDGFLAFRVSDFSRNDFGVGFYNTLAGTLEIQNQGGGIIASSDHRESERGGLLFNSGQILQGIREQVANSDEEESMDAPFVKLSDTFVSRLVNALPEFTSKPDAASSTDLMIGQVNVRELQPRIYQVCGEGPPGVEAAIIFDRRSSPLRTVSLGQYCGIVRAPRGFQSAVLEIRSPFGEVARKPAPIPPFPLCHADEVLDYSVDSGGELKLDYGCVLFQAAGGKYLPSSSEGSCENDEESISEGICAVREISLFESSSARDGTFQKVRTIRSPTRRNLNEAANRFHLKPDRKYRAVVFFRDGSATEPLEI